MYGQNGMKKCIQKWNFFQNILGHYFEHLRSKWDEKMDSKLDFYSEYSGTLFSACKVKMG
jgi:hypothetical protein